MISSRSALLRQFCGIFPPCWRRRSHSSSPAHQRTAPAPLFVPGLVAIALFAVACSSDPTDLPMEPARLGPPATPGPEGLRSAVAAVAAAVEARGQRAMGDMRAAPRGERDAAAGQGRAGWVDRRARAAAGAPDEEARRERRARAAGAAPAAGRRRWRVLGRCRYCRDRRPRRLRRCRNRRRDDHRADAQRRLRQAHHPGAQPVGRAR